MDPEVFLRDTYDLKHLFGDKWSPAIMIALSGGPMRRAEILSTVNSYTIDERWSEKHVMLHDSILARALKKMTGEGLLIRTSDAETFPPRVYYSLRPEVLEFLALTQQVTSWVSRHADLVTRAQAYNRRTVAPCRIVDLREIDDSVGDGDGRRCCGDIEEDTERFGAPSPEP